jgi:Terpene cyclase DEP1
MMLKSIAPTTKSVNSRQAMYLAIAIVGSIAPWYWILQDPAVLLSPMLFLERSFANHLATTWVTDVIISAIALWCFVAIELKRLGSSQRWLLLYVVLTLGVGVSCALPAFLYHRERLFAK